MSSEDIVAMARAAQANEGLSDGALYGKLANEIERLRIETWGLRNAMALHAGDCISLNNDLEMARAEIDDLNKLTATLRETLIEIAELVDSYVDIDAHGGPNLAMQVMTVLRKHAVLDK